MGGVRGGGGRHGAELALVVASGEVDTRGVEHLKHHEGEEDLDPPASPVLGENISALFWLATFRHLIVPRSHR